MMECFDSCLKSSWTGSSTIFLPWKSYTQVKHFFIYTLPINWFWHFRSILENPRFQNYVKQINRQPFWQPRNWSCTRQSQKRLSKLICLFGFCSFVPKVCKNLREIVEMMLEMQLMHLKCLLSFWSKDASCQPKISLIYLAILPHQSSSPYSRMHMKLHAHGLDKVA